MANFLVLFSLILLLYFLFRRTEVVCKDCGFVGKLRKSASGNLLIEVILWCCFLIPGLIYTIWSSSSRKYKCPTCSGHILIPTDSPVGRKLLGEHRPDVNTQKTQSVAIATDRKLEVEKISFNKNDNFSIICIVFFISWAAWSILSNRSNSLTTSAKDSNTTTNASTSEQPESKARPEKHSTLVSKKSTSAVPDWNGDYSFVQCEDKESCRKLALKQQSIAKPNEYMPYLAAACNQGTFSFCLTVGMYFDKVFRPKIKVRQASKALDWYVKGCKLGLDENNCIMAMRLDFEFNKLNQAKEIYREYCSVEKNQEYCRLESDLRENIPVSKYRLNPKKLRKILDMLCAEGHEFSCDVIKNRFTQPH